MFYQEAFNLVSFCSNLPVWQANKIPLAKLVFLRVEIQNDKTLVPSKLKIRGNDVFKEQFVSASSACAN